MTQGSRAKLREMIGDLRYYHRELDQAQEHGDDAVRASMQRMIGTECARIREHCAEHGLAVPTHVPLPD